MMNPPQSLPAGSGATVERLWFALVVKPRHEKAVARTLRARELEEFLPLYRERRAWSDRVKAVELPLFSGYVFCRFAYEERLQVLNAPGVICILGAGDVFSPVADSEIATIHSIVRSGLPARPCAYLAPGEMVRVEEGPLAGINGRILRNKGVTSVIITVETLKRSVAVELDYDAIRPVSPINFRTRGCASSL